MVLDATDQQLIARRALLQEQLIRHQPSLVHGQLPLARSLTQRHAQIAHLGGLARNRRHTLHVRAEHLLRLVLLHLLSRLERPVVAHVRRSDDVLGSGLTYTGHA